MKEVKEKFNDARSKFMVRFLCLDNILLNDLSLSLIANFFDPCSRCPWHSRPCQRQDQRASASCRLFQDSDLFKSNICSQGQIARRLQFIEETLGHRVIPQAKYASKEQKKREYHEGTRKGVLNEIRLWTDTYSDTENCWWITGKPGVGKSTIGAKVAEIFKDEKSLYAQYFTVNPARPVFHLLR